MAGLWAPGGSVAADQRSLRRSNLARVLSSLRDDGPRSRARLAGDLQLNKATVSSLVAELAERGLVRDGLAERGSVGRPGTTVELAGGTVCGVGAEINVNHVATLALDLVGNVVSERRISVDAAGSDPRQVVGTLQRLITGTLEDLARIKSYPVAVVVGTAGLVDRQRGTLTFAPNLGWRDVPIADLLREMLGEPSYPVEVHNEANLAAVAEATPGEPERRDILVLHGEAGVGGGIVVDGRLVSGRHGYAGEIGHMTVESGGRRCGCGRIGCWETVVGLSRLLELAADADDELRAPGLGLEQRVAEINRRAEQGDARTLAALREVAHWLGVGAATLANVLNPGVIVLSGYLAEVGRWMQEVVEEELALGVLAPASGGTTVAMSTLGFGAAVRGGAKVAIDLVFDDPTLVARPVGDELGAIS